MGDVQGSAFFAASEFLIEQADLPLAAEARRPAMPRLYWKQADWAVALAFGRGYILV